VEEGVFRWSRIISNVYQNSTMDPIVLILILLIFGGGAFYAYKNGLIGVKSSAAPANTYTPPPVHNTPSAAPSGTARVAPSTYNDAEPTEEPAGEPAEEPAEEPDEEEATVFDEAGLTEISLSKILSWNEADAKAKSNGGRLPTREELIDNSATGGNTDVWHPVYGGDWVQIGKHGSPKCPKYCRHRLVWGDAVWSNTSTGAHQVGSSRFQSLYISKATEPKGLTRVSASSRLSFADAKSLASAHGGRLPTREELAASGVSAGAKDVWHPTDGGDWVQIGAFPPAHNKNNDGSIKCYKYCSHNAVFGVPNWANNNSGDHRVGSSRFRYLHIFKD